MSKVTRIAYSTYLNEGKRLEITELAKRLGQLRTDFWGRFGSINGVGIRHRDVRNQWVAEGREFNVQARLWKETLRDVLADIDAYREAAKVKSRACIRRRTQDEEERKRLYGLLKWHRWTEDSYLRRIMRRYFKHGHTSVNDQIVLDNCCYTTFVQNDQAWIKVMGLTKGRRIAIPLNTNVAPTGTLRLILRNDRIEVHYSVDAKQYEKGCGPQTIGVDKGYTEAFVDSDGDHHGKGLGGILSAESDYLKAKYQNRNKIQAIAKAKPHKAAAIFANNLGRKKLDRRKHKHTQKVRTLVFQAAHKLADKADVIACEDLTSPIPDKKKYGKNQSRRLSGWVKGVMAEALDSLSHSRGSAVQLVNAAYTSQIDSVTGLLEGERKGDLFYRDDGNVLQADWNAALNVLARLTDPEIDQWTPYQKVRSILLERTERHRRGLTLPGHELEPFGCQP